jgi:hypothetical protein
MALPLVASRDIVIEVVGELISRPYIEITLNMLQRFGIAVRRDGWERFTIPAGSRYQSPGEIHVEADASSASYFVALGALAGVGAPVRIEGVGAGSIQGDIRFVEAAQQMGAAVASGPNWLEVRRGAWPLKAIALDCNHVPDAAMTLAVMALYADGPTTLRNIASWRVKETDRLAAMARPNCASWAPPWRKARTPSRSRRRPAGPRPPSTPTTTTAWPCASRWPPSIRPARTSASWTRSAWPRPSRTSSRRCSPCPRRPPPTFP